MDSSGSMLCKNITISFFYGEFFDGITEFLSGCILFLYRGAFFAAVLLVRGGVLSALVPSYCSNLLTGLLFCVAVCTESEDAIEITSVFSVSEGCFSTSHHVIILLLSDFIMKASWT